MPISDSYALGNVTGTDSVGGLVGTNSGAITNSYAAGAVAGTTNTGGLVGEDATPNVTMSYYDSDTTGQTDTGKGDGFSSAQMTTQANFTGAGWDFTTIWQMNDGVSYPYHQWYTGPAPGP
jgi:hypothetical protein